MTPCAHSLWYSIPHTVYLQSGNRTPALPSRAQVAENYTSITCARQVYVMPDPGLNGAAIGGDAIAEVCIRKTERLCEGILKLEDRHHSAETSVIAITS
jgi:hypothetical protein